MPQTTAGEGYRDFTEPMFLECETESQIDQIRNPVDKAHVFVSADDGSANFTLWKFDRASTDPASATVKVPTNPAFAVSGRWFKIPTGGGAGTGDVTGPASSTANAPVIFNGVTGKIIKEGTIAESGLSFADVTTGNVSSTKHGFAPKGDGTTTKYLNANGAYSTPSGGGDVVGPASATDNAITRYDTGTGKLVQNSGVTIDDSNNLVVPGTITTGSSGTGQIDIGTTGVRITDDGDGAITFKSLSSGSAEDFTINLDDTANTAVVTSSTGLATFNFSSIALQQSGVAVVDLTASQVLTNKTLTTPTIADLTNATHTHQNTAGGGTLAESALALTDIATNNSSTSKHGFLLKLNNSSTQYMDGTGAWSTPAGSGGTGAGGPLYVATASATVANSSAETSIVSATGTGSKTLAANSLAQGKNINFRVYGYLGTDAATPGTLTVKVKLGSTVIWNSGALTLANAISAKEFLVSGDISVRTAGASGTTQTQADMRYSDGTTQTGYGPFASNTSTATIDTTATQVLDVTATWSVADADNTITGSNAIYSDGLGLGASALAIASGGTGQATATAAFDALSPTTTRGDIIVRGASSNGRVALGGVGQALRSDGTDLTWQEPYNHVVFFDEFLIATSATVGETFWQPSGTGLAPTLTTVDTTHPGTVLFSTSTSTSGTSALSKGSASVIFGGGRWIFEGLAKLNTLSDGTNTFILRIGFVEQNVALTGAWLEYTHSANSGNWTVHTATNPTPSVVSGSTAVQTSTYFKFKIDMNAAATSCSMTIDGVEQGPGTLNIPTVLACSPRISLVKSAGATAATLTLDWTKITYIPTSAR